MEPEDYDTEYISALLETRRDDGTTWRDYLNDGQGALVKATFEAELTPEAWYLGKQYGEGRFHVYLIAPFDEAQPCEVISGWQSADDPNQSAQKQSDAEKEKQAKEGALKEPVYLQTGSFQNAADADNQKAKLALMGAEASVQQVMLQDKVWYRVRLGPFRKMDEVNSMRSDLAKQGIEANVVKKD